MSTLSLIVAVPGSAPKRVTIEGGLKALQDLVGGYIEMFTHPDLARRGVLAYVNEEGIRLDLPLNFVSEFHGPILGTAVFFSDAGENEGDVGTDQEKAIVDFLAARRSAPQGQAEVEAGS